jgi:peptide/nickel transport system substrate-binding protein
MGREEQELHEWVHRVAHGEASRRHFLCTMLGLGLSGSLIADLLATAPPAAAQGSRAAQQAFIPTKRGGGGKLRLLYWQAPTILNAHFAAGAKDEEASRVVYEPLISVNPDAERIPILASEIPSLENGGRAPDGTWTLWRLKQGVVWHDGTPFTADDVVFTWEFTADPATATSAVTRGAYENVLRIDKLNDHTVKVVFKEPTPLWATGGGVHVLPKHRFAEYKGANARNAPYNLKPVGTGPYKLVDFKPGDAALYDINPHYHVPNRPFFDTVELKGGGNPLGSGHL